MVMGTGLIVASRTGPGHPTAGNEFHHIYRQATAPTASDPLEVGDVWSDTTAALIKRCTSLSPITFVSIEGGVAHNLFSSTHSDVDESDTPANDDVLTFDSGSSKWRGEPASGHGTHGDVSGPSSSVDNAIVRFDGTTGKIIQDYTSKAPTIDDDGGAIFLDHIDLLHTASEADDHALEIILNAAGFGDVKALDINYTTGAISAGEDEAVILVNLDESLATGGNVAALEVLSTEGSANVIGLEAGVLVNPILQLSGTFGDMDLALVNATDRLAEFISSGSDIVLFVANGDTVTIGDLAKFEELEFLLDTVASGAGVKPTFEFSTGVGTWGTFTPTDGTNAFRNTGVIAWLDSDIPSWAVGTSSPDHFLIRITRTRVSLSTTPVEDKVQIAVATEFSWDKDGDLNINALTIGGDIDFNSGIIDLSTQTVAVTLNAAVDALNFDSNTLSIDASNNRVGIGTNAPNFALHVTGRIETDGAMLFNEGPATIDNLFYVGSTSAGEVNASFGFFVAGVGSGSHLQGPNFIGRGNNFTAKPTQQGKMFFQSGTPVPAGTGDGEIEFRTDAISGHIVFQTDGGNNRLQIRREGVVFLQTASLGIGTVTPDHQLEVEEISALTNSVQTVFKMTHETTDTPAAGIGVGMVFDQESLGGRHVIAGIDAVLTDVTDGSEDADLIISLMVGGAAAAEKLRIDSAGLLTVTSIGSVSTIDINGGSVDGATIGAASASTIIGTTIDATTDFTIGATVITDGVITDATGLSIVANTVITGTLGVGAQTISDGSGNLASANGVASFGPSAVASITIVNGIVTAIS